MGTMMLQDMGEGDGVERIEVGRLNVRGSRPERINALMAGLEVVCFAKSWLHRHHDDLTRLLEIDPADSDLPCYNTRV
jgi:hypothetical protein